MKYSNEELIEFYRKLVRARKFDELNIKMASEGKLLTFYHSCNGHEAIGVGACSCLEKKDYLYAHLRGHGVPYAIGKGISPKTCIAEHLGKATGWGGGITGFHAASREEGNLGVGGTIGTCFVLSVGYALAAKKNGEGQIAMCFTGDGGVQRGQAHEAMNMASVWKLPVVWIVENNMMSWFTPFCDTFALKDIAPMAKTYNMPGVIVDGMDVLAVHEAVNKAVKRARDGKGPSLIECKTFRFRPHSEGRPDVSHSTPRDKNEIEKWKKKDPIVTFKKKLMDEKILTDAIIAQIDEEGAEEIKEAEKFALESPYPDPARLKDLVYAP